VDYNGEQDDFYFPPVPPYQERVELDDFTLVTVAASFQLRKNLQLFARLENALDEDYEEVIGYVAPGRSAYAGIRYRFAD
jgi:vitamin B12 transporter